MLSDKSYDNMEQLTIKNYLNLMVDETRGNKNLSIVPIPDFRLKLGVKHSRIREL